MIAPAHPFRITLPWPPSNNTYYRHVGAKVLISAKGRKYRTEVAGLVGIIRARGGLPASALAGGINLCIWASPPDRRRRDLDNMLKAAQDALTKAGVWADDSQINELSIVRMDPIEGGLLKVEIREAAGSVAFEASSKEMLNNSTEAPRPGCISAAEFRAGKRQ